MIFCWSWCPFCKKTCALLKEQGIPFKCVKTDLQEDNFNFQNAVVYKSKQRKVPNIWIDGKQMGGNSHIQEAYKNGELKTWIEDAGIQHNLKPYVASEHPEEKK